MPTQGDPAYDDTAFEGRRLKPRGKRRKPFAIEHRLVLHPEHPRYGYDSWWRDMEKWRTWSKYETEARRDQAIENLSKKEMPGQYRFHYEYRKA